MQRFFRIHFFLSLSPWLVVTATTVRSQQPNSAVVKTVALAHTYAPVERIQIIISFPHASPCEILGLLRSCTLLPVPQQHAVHVFHLVRVGHLSNTLPGVVSLNMPL